MRHSKKITLYSIKNPTVLKERVGSLRLDSLDSNLSLSTRPRGAAATAAATCRDVSTDSHCDQTSISQPILSNAKNARHIANTRRLEALPGGVKC
jgi:hypothetical protein